MNEENTPNVVINIDTAYNVNPAATKVENTFNIYSDKAGAEAITEALGTKNSTLSTDSNRRPSERRAELVRAMLSEKEEDEVKLSTLNSTLYKGEPEPDTDCTPIRTEILKYVSRVRPLLIDEAKSDFMKVWEDILDLREVESLVYKPGKQKGTNFNRDLVANILYFLRHWKIYRVVYKQDYNGAALTEALEQDKEHSVKHALRDDPPQPIRDAITAMMKRKHELWP